MNTKTRILELLESEKSNYLSGEVLADTLKISRNAVWKAIQELKKSGHKINAVTNKGYSLSADSDIVSAQGIRNFLRDKTLADKIHVHESLESTNKTAKEMAISDAAHGTVVISDTQTHGKGRYKRSFFSPPNGGLYMSFILRPENLRFENVTTVTALAAVSACEAIESVTSLSPKIKWVNDIFIGGKKVSGILTEAVTDFESGSPHWIVLGIGINVNTPTSDFPESIRETAASLNGDSGSPISRNVLAAEIINRITDENTQCEKEIFAKYKTRLMVLGEKISVFPIGADAPYTATAYDINTQGHLIVQTNSGETAALSSGEIQLLQK